MSWTEIKHALNSSVGTSEFEPLDKTLEKILNNYHVVASSNKIGEIEKSYTIKYNGFLKVSIAVESRYSGPATQNIKIIVGDSENNLYFSFFGQDEKTQSLEIEVKKGDTIKVERVENNSYISVSGYIGGDVRPGDTPLTLQPLQ